MPITLVEGWTGPIQMTLKDDGELKDLTGATVELRLWNNNHEEVVEAGALTVPIAVSGLIQFDPDSADFTEELSPYYVRVQVDDALLDRTFYPSADLEVWTVRGVGP